MKLYEQIYGVGVGREAISEGVRTIAVICVSNDMSELESGTNINLFYLLQSTCGSGYV